MTPDKRKRLSVLEGHLKLGMRKEVLGLATEILADPAITAEEFRNALNAVLVQETRLSPWTNLVQSAYERLPLSSRKVLQADILSFFVSLNDLDSASRYLPSKPASPLEVFMSMDVLLGKDNLAAAKPLARRAEKMLLETTKDEERQMLYDALSRYYARSGQWNLAAACWTQMNPADALGENGIIGLVELNIASALRAVDEGLDKVAAQRQSSVGDLDLVLPGNEKKRLRSIERRLVRYKRALEKLLPERRQRELGMSALPSTPR